MKKIMLSCIAMCSMLTANAQYANSLAQFDINTPPKREVRAVWLTTLANLDWPKTFATSPENIERQKQELIQILDQYSQANINTVLLQARVRAATIYPSDIEPWDQCITGVEGRAPMDNYDPLKFAIEECHKRGMEIHAWIAAIPVGASKSLGCRLLKQKGFDIRSFQTGSYINPADPKVADYLASVCAEITRKYDIDGINLDYIRYPDGWSSPSYRNGDTPDNRRYNITKIVAAISKEVKRLKPWVKISCSPIGKYADLGRYSSKGFNARDKVSQEAQEWVRLGYMDQLYPMQYFRGDNYYPFCADWVENAYGKDMVTGLGTYFLDPREGKWTLSDIKRQMYVSRSLGMGHAHFRSKFLTDNRQGVYDFEKLFNFTAAITPPMTWISKNRPPSPTVQKGFNDIKFIIDRNTTTIRWSGSTPYYNIYASTTYPVDITDAANLVHQRYDRNSFTIIGKGKQRMYYAITAMDNYGNESLPLQEGRREFTEIESNQLRIAKDEILLPESVKSMDISYFAICDLQGRIVKKIYADKKNTSSIKIYQLENGAYKLYAYAKKHNIRHRIGVFLLKR